jgi:NAD(P)-dependent dehydrogenase (short-subunit alcohol dehydrogenase family)
VLSRLGADVAVTGTGRDPSRYPDEEKAIGWHDIESVADEIRSLGRKALPLVSDASDSSAVDAMVERVVGELGRVDILVCNAAAPMGEDRVPLLEVDRDVFKRVVDVKVLGSFYAAQAVGNRLKRQNQGGSIVFISSISGKRGQANTAAYNAANFAVNGMMQSTAKELAPMGINVNAVCPGLIPTSRWDGVDWTARLGQVPAGRGGTYEEVGELIAFLCTPAAAYINGQAINIDGGMVTEH